MEPCKTKINYKVERIPVEGFLGDDVEIGVVESVEVFLSA